MACFKNVSNRAFLFTEIIYILFWQHAHTQSVWVTTKLENEDYSCSRRTDGNNTTNQVNASLWHQSWFMNARKRRCMRSERSLTWEGAPLYNWFCHANNSLSFSLSAWNVMCNHLQYASRTHIQTQPSRDDHRVSHRTGTKYDTSSFEQFRFRPKSALLNTKGQQEISGSKIQDSIGSNTRENGRFWTELSLLQMPSALCMLAGDRRRWLGPRSPIVILLLCSLLLLCMHHDSLNYAKFVCCIITGNRCIVPLYSSKQNLSQRATRNALPAPPAPKQKEHTKKQTKPK